MSMQIEYTAHVPGHGDIVYPKAIAKVMRVVTRTDGITGVVFIWRDIDSVGVGQPIGKTRIQLPYTDKISGTKNYIKRVYEKMATMPEFANGIMV